ncbi:hypothetical protein BpHYR1_012337 [Brachionus plicatilis]|uniref:Uncharacterized protein n=1 Tax=Brachionus plicatilis TaxID=10195 RepID=A0A3M7PUE6_BRAPC|nr:hypothetical protein BpHYR1_012337 [Brachionus plicatilis]
MNIGKSDTSFYFVRSDFVLSVKNTVPAAALASDRSLRNGKPCPMAKVAVIIRRRERRMLAGGKATQSSRESANTQLNRNKARPPNDSTTRIELRTSWAILPEAPYASSSLMVNFFMNEIIKAVLTLINGMMAKAIKLNFQAEIRA